MFYNGGMKQRVTTTLKNHSRLLLLLLVILLFITVIFSRVLDKGGSCPLPTADPNGYLAAICQYVRDNDIDVSPADPTRYGIVRTEMSEQNGRAVILVFLDCCYLGDVAIIDMETGEVIDFRVGAK